MVKKDKIVLETGKRRLAVARATIRAGNGKIYINSKPLELWGTDVLRMWIREPLILAGDAVKNVDINVNVKGGGIVGQAEAIRQAIAKGLVSYFKDKKLKNKFIEYDRNLLVYDPRRNEPHHSSGKGASKRGSRRHKQRSKR
ncbi:MAG: 30S ribosomal protein S9 [Candidatus Aenigmarchaeota archaeon]|nr:30S ribosomal protein S9 [Candidatus Aenigmarchaeota archaeon]MCX8190631.1 30S ribosomal protein S9 [Candidatus Aenigmarchaeota archaeon]MDW8160174.1 30S ribosomal protein S9 [Candidatus Aenigmarchaeota archaeon]